jgi:hypothetical protein
MTGDARCPTAGDILIPSGRSDGTAVAISVEELPAGSRLASRKVGVVLGSCEWDENEKEDGSIGQLVEAVVAPPISTVTPVASLTKTSVRVAISLLSMVAIAGCLAIGLWQHQLQQQQQQQQQQPMQQPMQRWGRPWHPQCYQQYINRSDGYRNVEKSGYGAWGSFSFFADGYVPSQLQLHLYSHSIFACAMPGQSDVPELMGCWIDCTGPLLAQMTLTLCAHNPMLFLTAQLTHCFHKQQTSVATGGIVSLAKEAMHCPCTQYQSTGVVRIMVAGSPGITTIDRI